MANDFFTRFSEIVKEQNGAAADDGGADTPARADADTAQEAAALLGSKPAEEPPTEAAADRPASAGTTRSRGLPPLVWLAGLVLAIAILLAFVL